MYPACPMAVERQTKTGFHACRDDKEESASNESFELALFYAADRYLEKAAPFVIVFAFLYAAAHLVAAALK